MIFHTEPRYTKDLDVWIEPTTENAEKVLRALAKFGAPISAVTVADLVERGNFLVLGRAPNRIDVITSIEALVFADAWRGRSKGTYGGEPVGFLSREDLVRNKRAVGRPQDLLDASKLEEWTQHRRPGRPRKRKR